MTSTWVVPAAALKIRMSGFDPPRWPFAVSRLVNEPQTDGHLYWVAVFVRSTWKMGFVFVDDAAASTVVRLREGRVWVEALLKRL